MLFKTHRTELRNRVNFAEVISQEICYLFIYLCLFRAAPAAYGVSQARDLIGATATATWDPSCVCDLHHSSRQCWILNPLSEARGQTCNLMVPRWICCCWAMKGTPRNLSFIIVLHYCLRNFLSS